MGGSGWISEVVGDGWRLWKSERQRVVGGLEALVWGLGIRS